MDSWLYLARVSMCIFFYCMFFFLLCFVFFKQKTAYEMHISDWSSDVCSSDLRALGVDRATFHVADAIEWRDDLAGELAGFFQHRHHGVGIEIGRASCRERVCQYV